MRIALVATALCVVALLIAVVTDLRRNAALGPVTNGLLQDLGFDYGTPYQHGHEVFVITKVEPGKAAARAGVQAGDLITGYADTRLFFGDLERSRGSPIVISLERGGKPIRVTVRVPRRATTAR